MIKKWFLIFLCFTVFQHVYSQKAVYQLPVDEKTSLTNPTFFYTLPKTAFKVDVVITKTSEIKGIYAEYAEKMLGINNYCKESTVSYHLKNLSVTPFSVPDESLQFVAELSSAQMKKNFFNALYENKSSSGFQDFSTLESNHADILPDFFKNYADVILQQTYETYTETKIVDGVVTQVPVTQTKTTSKTVAQQVQQAADFIEKIREDRYAIQSFSQETALTKDAFEYLINQLNTLEKQYLELFTGIKVKEDFCETFVVYPKNPSELLPLCTVASDIGFSAASLGSTANNYALKFTPQTITSFQTGFNELLTEKNKTYTGYSLRKAVPVLVTLMHGNTEESILGLFPIYQFGVLETLPANLDSFDIGKWGYIY